MKIRKTEIAQLIFDNLTANRELLKMQFLKSKDTIGYFFIDD